MKLTFLGAAHEVTGSCFYLEAAGKRILVDCGMQQGIDEFEVQDVPIRPQDIDFVLLTHAHIDHSGLLPLIRKKGFNGNIYATEATCDLCNIMLRDSAHIQEFEAEWRNRKAKRAGKAEFIPLYTMEDAEITVDKLVPLKYDERIEICEGIQVRFVDVGHLLGSASIEIWINEGEISKKIVFSGDIGNDNQPLLKDRKYIDDADYVVMESTYGTRSHSENIDYIAELASVIQRTLDRGGNVIIPSFAVGRTQEILYFLRKIKEQKLIRNHDNFPVYMDSPLAIEATHIFNDNITDCYDEEALELVRQGINPIYFDDLHTILSSDDSKLINTDFTPKVIISSSGMCDAGRIKHHLKHNLWRPECTVLFTGFQAIGTLGRTILDGATQVKILGEEIEVCAEIAVLNGISAHADDKGLIKWITHFRNTPKKVFIVHGESSTCDAFAERLNKEYGIPAYAPYYTAQYDLAANICLHEGIREHTRNSAKTVRRAASAFAKLLDAGKRLLRVIEKNEGCANKDLSKFTDQITALCNKWDR